MKSGYIDRRRVLEQTVTLEFYHSNFVFTVVTQLKAWEITLHHLGSVTRPILNQDKEEQSGKQEESPRQPVICWKGEDALALLQACEKW